MGLIDKTIVFLNHRSRGFFVSIGLATSVLAAVSMMILIPQMTPQLTAAITFCLTVVFGCIYFTNDNRAAKNKPALKDELLKMVEVTTFNGTICAAFVIAWVTSESGLRLVAAFFNALVAIAGVLIGVMLMMALWVFKESIKPPS